MENSCNSVIRRQMQWKKRENFQTVTSPNKIYNDKSTRNMCNSTPLVIREMQIKTTEILRHTIWMSKVLKRTWLYQIFTRIQSTCDSQVLLLRLKNGTVTLESSCAIVFVRLTLYFPYDLVLWLLNIYSRKRKHCA